MLPHDRPRLRCRQGRSPSTTIGSLAGPSPEMVLLVGGACRSCEPEWPPSEDVWSLRPGTASPRRPSAAKGARSLAESTAHPSPRPQPAAQACPARNKSSSAAVGGLAPARLHVKAAAALPCRKALVTSNRLSSQDARMAVKVSRRNGVDHGDGIPTCPTHRRVNAAAPWFQRHHHKLMP